MHEFDVGQRLPEKAISYDQVPEVSFPFISESTAP
jgi:hypothetical protein